MIRKTGTLSASTATRWKAHAASGLHSTQHVAAVAAKRVSVLPHAAASGLVAATSAITARLTTLRKAIPQRPIAQPSRTATAKRTETKAAPAMLAPVANASIAADLSVLDRVRRERVIATPAPSRAAPGAATRARRGISRAINIVVTMTLLVALTLAIVPVSMFAYTNTLWLAHDGQLHLKSAESDFKALMLKPTDLALINDAQNQMQLAHNDFVQLQVRVTLASPAGFIPSINAKLSGAQKLVPLAIEGTQAGIYATDALKTLVTGLKNPLGASGGLTSADTDQIISDVDQIQSLYGQMAPQIMALTPADLSLAPSLWPTITSVQAKLPQVTQLVNDIGGLAHALPGLLGVGAPSSYLVEVLDSSELRPTGGFIGNFGVLTLTNGRLDSGFHISDITLIDSSNKFDNAKYKYFIQIPRKYNWLRAVFVDPNSASWSLRDSNLDPNYPTVAEYALSLYPRLLPSAQKNLQAQGSTLQLYDPAKSGQFAGVITLSLGFFAEALNTTGPLRIDQPGIHETVTSQNFVAKIHSYALGANATGPDNKACGVTSCSKIFTSAVVKAFMDKVKSNLPLYVAKLGKLFYDSLKTKDVEVYLTAPEAEKTLQSLNMAGTVAAPATGDSLFQVDANIGANKDNGFLKYQMSDTITLDASGNATHKLNWSYTWPRDPATLKETFPAGGIDYFAYSRIYTPPSSTLISQDGLTSFGSDMEFNRLAYHGNVTDSYGQTSSYTLSWRVPDAVTVDSTGYHYRLTLQREAGIVWPLKLTINLPACGIANGAPSVSGLTSQNLVEPTGHGLVITGPLTQDAQVQIDYTCSSLAQTNPSASSPNYYVALQMAADHWQTVASRLIHP
ncbi:MAG TPA: DUF4012 domain-containing protein [Ktedonobacterales bacterium]